MNADVAERHRSGLSAVPSTAQPCGSKRDGPPAVREPRRIQTRAEHDLDAHGAGRVGWGELATCDEFKRALNCYGFQNHDSNKTELEMDRPIDMNLFL